MNLSAAEWNDQRLGYTLRMEDDRGLCGRADWDQQGNHANFQVRSSLNLKTFLDAFGLGEPVADMTFHSPPFVEISGSLNFGENRFRPAIIGHVVFSRFTYKTVPFSELTTDFSWDGERTLLRDARLQHQTGQLRADLFDAPNDFRLNRKLMIAPARACFPGRDGNFGNGMAALHHPSAIRARITIRRTGEAPERSR
jgi:hypothetical protein